MSVRTYDNPAAFKAALEDRIRRDATGMGIQRRRQLVVFSRLLARIDRVFGPTTILKGGFALEIRLEHARTTRDIDLVLIGPEGDLLERLQSAGQVDAGDFMTFEIQPNPEQPEITGDGVLYGGKRFRAECKLAGKIYGARFGVDVVVGGKMLGPPSIISTEPYLDFAGIASPSLRVLPIETHIAEKLHAYTIPRTTPNARVRDLPDIALLATTSEPTLVAARIRDALRLTFDARGTHPLPSALPDPPDGWRAAYKELAAEHGLRWDSLEAVTRAAREFLDPILNGTELGNWDREAWRWSA